MEKKTIGQFIATLRKANGMTQKQLAEKLNVSDKAVSRWERDESLPDLSLIPVLAEIFQVTSDEILRGERFNQEKGSVTRDTEKSKKQLKHLLNETKVKCTTRSIIALGIGLTGLLAAMICNFGVLRAYIGFIVACIFYLAAVLAEVIFTIQAFASIQNDEFEQEEVVACKDFFRQNAVVTISVIVLLFAATLPLVVIPWDTYMGVGAGEWLSQGLFYAGITGILCIAVLEIHRQISLHKRKESLSEQEKEENRKVNAIRKKYGQRLIVALAITLVAQGVIVSVISPETFASGITFTSIEDFKEYMETDVSGMNEDSGMAYIYYDESGNEISEEEALKEYIYAADGETIAAEYLHRNEEVAFFDVEWKNENDVVITVYREQDIAMGVKVVEKIEFGWKMLYLVEISAFLAVYAFKKKELKSS